MYSYFYWAPDLTPEVSAWGWLGASGPNPRRVLFPSPNRAHAPNIRFFHPSFRFSQRRKSVLIVWGPMRVPPWARNSLGFLFQLLSHFRPFCQWPGHFGGRYLEPLVQKWRKSGFPWAIFAWCIYIYIPNLKMSILPSICSFWGPGRIKSSGRRSWRRWRGLWRYRFHQFRRSTWAPIWHPPWSWLNQVLRKCGGTWGQHSYFWHILPYFDLLVLQMSYICSCGPQKYLC